MKCWAEIVVHREDRLRPDLRERKKSVLGFGFSIDLRILVYLVMYDSVHPLSMFCSRGTLPTLHVREDRLRLDIRERQKPGIKETVRTRFWNI